MERPNAWKTYKKTELKKVTALAEEYKAFIDHGKTERECTAEIIAALEKAGYVALDKGGTARPRRHHRFRGTQ